MHMDTALRMISSRLLEKMRKNPEYTVRLGLMDQSISIPYINSETKGGLKNE